MRENVRTVLVPANTMLRFSFAIFNVFRWIFIGCSAHRDSSSRTLHPLGGSKNVWDNEHDPEGGAPAADPGHAGEVTSLGWFGNASVFLDELAGD